jgi:hypothetical protein
MDDIHASADLPVVKPKHEMTEREYHPRQAFAMVRDELTQDAPEVGAYCSQRPEAEFPIPPPMPCFLSTFWRLLS